MRVPYFLFASVLLLFLPAASKAQTTSFIDETFATVGGTPLRFDLWLPGPIDAARPWPLAIYIHGGGWQSGTYKRPAPVRMRLIDEGIAVASVQYRLTTQGDDFGGESVVYPAQIYDVKGAIRFLRANASIYGIDPDRIAVYGTSAGAHLACVAAAGGNEPRIEGTVGGNADQSSAVAGFIAISAPTDLLNMQPDFTDPPGSSSDHDAPTSSESLLIGFSGEGEGIGVLRENIDNPSPPFPELKERVELASPVTLVDPADPPGLIIHGTEDRTVPVYQAQRLADAMGAEGVSFELIIAEGLGHVQTTPEIDDQMVEYFRELLLEDNPADGWTIH